MGATHFLTKTLPRVATEMALSVLAYNLTRVINIVDVKPLIASGHSGGHRSVTHSPTALSRCPQWLSDATGVYSRGKSPNADDHNDLIPCGTVFTFLHDQDPDRNRTSN